MAQVQRGRPSEVASSADMVTKQLVTHAKSLDIVPPGPVIQVTKQIQPIEKGPMIPIDKMAHYDKGPAMHKATGDADRAIDMVRSHAAHLQTSMLSAATIDRSMARRELERVLEAEDRRELEAEARAVEASAERVERARERGESVSDLAANVTDSIEIMPEAAGLLRSLRAAGASPAILQAVRSAIRDFREGGNEAERHDFRERGQQILRMARFYLEHRETLARPEMAQAREALERVLTGLSGRSREGTMGDAEREMTRRAQSIFGEIERVVRDAQGLERATTTTTLQSFSDQLLRLRGIVGDQNLRQGIDRMREQIDALRRRVEGGARPSEEDVRGIDARMAYLTNARDGILRGREGPEVAHLERILGRGLSALLGGNEDQARAHLFLASQADQATAERRGPLEEISQGLAEGRIQLPQALASIADHLRERIGALTGRTGVRDPESRGILDRIASRLGEGTPTLDSLTRASSAVSAGAQIAQEERRIQREERRIARLPREERQEARAELGQAMPIFSRSLHSLEGEAPIEVAAAQLQLGRAYIGADHAMRERIGRMSERLEQAGQMREMERLVSHQAQRLSPERAAARVLGEGATGAAITALVTQFNNAGADQQTRERSIARMEQEGVGFVTLLARRDALSQLSGAAQEGSAERGMFGSVIRSIDRLLGDLSEGNQIPVERLRGAERQMVMLLGTGDQIAASFATSEDTDERREQLEAVQGLTNAHEAIESLRGDAREQASRMYQRGLDALAEGNSQDAIAYFSFAQAYAQAPEGAEREVVQREFTRFDNRTMTPEQAERLPPEERPVTAEAGRTMARFLLERESTLWTIEDSELRSRALRYYNFAYRALRSGDVNGAELMQTLADMIGRASHLDQADPSVQRVLALINGSEELGIPSIEQLREAMYREPPPTVAQVLFQDASPEQAAQSMDELQIRMADLDIGLGDAEFRSMTTTVDTPRARRRYERERQRLERRRTRLRGADAEAMDHQIQIADIGRTSTQLDHARQYHEEGTTLLHRAAELRIQALHATDDAERQRLNEEANGLAQRGTALVQSAEGLQQATLGIHQSVTRLHTRRRERGRLELASAADSFAQAGEIVHSAPQGALSDATGQQVVMHFQRASADLQQGSVQVSQQLAIHQQDQALLRWERRLEEQNERHEGEYCAIGNSVRMPGSSIEIDQGPLAPEGTVAPVMQMPDERMAYDGEWVRERLSRARRARRAERFTSARRYLGAAQEGMPIQVTRAQAARRHWQFMDGDPQAGILPASRPERQRARLDEFPMDDFDRRLESALTAADEGRYGDARDIREQVADEIVWRGHRQEMGNRRSVVRSLTTYLQGLPNPNEVFGELSREQREGDIEAARAHDRNAELIRQLGIFDNIQQDRGEIVARLQGVEAGYTRAIGAVQSTADIPAQGVVYDLARGAFELGQGPLAGLAGRAPLETLRDLVRARDQAGIMRFFSEHPDMLRRSAEHLGAVGQIELAELGEIRDGIRPAVALGLVAETDYGTSMRDYQEHARGWNASILFATRGLENLDRGDQLTRAHVTDGHMRDALRGHGARFLQLSVYASEHPEDISRDIATGRPISTRAITISRRDMLDVEGDRSVYDEFHIQIGAQGRGLVAQFRDTARAELEILQDIGQRFMGIGPEAEEPTDEAGRRFRDQVGAQAYRQIMGYYREAVGVGDADVRATFASLGFDIDLQTERGRRIDLGEGDEGRHREEALRAAAEHVSEARQNFFNVVTGMRTWVSHDERGEAFDAIHTHTGAVMSILDEQILNPRPDRPHMTMEQARDQIGAFRTHLDGRVRALTEEGAGEDRIWGIGRMLIEIPVAGLVSLVPGGGIVVAGYFMTGALEAFEEQRVMAGGWHQMTTTQQILAGGGVALAALGFATSGASSLMGELGALSRGSGSLRSVLGAEAMAGLEIAPTGVAGELSRSAMFMQRSMGVAHYTMIGGGLGMGALQVYDMYSQSRLHGTEFGWGEALLAGFQAAQPFIQMGMHGAAQRWRPSLMYGSGFGAHMYRGTMMVLFGVSPHDMAVQRQFAIHEQYTRMISTVPEGMPREVHAQVVTQRRTAIAQVEHALGRPLEPQEGIALLQHFGGTDSRGRPRAIDSRLGAELLRGYDAHVQQQISGLSPEYMRQIGRLQDRLGRTLDPGELLAIARQYPERIPDAGDVARFLERSQSLGAREGELTSGLSRDDQHRYRDLQQELNRRMGRPLRLDERVALLDRFSSVRSADDAVAFFDQRAAGLRGRPVEEVTGEVYTLSRYAAEEYHPQQVETAVTRAAAMRERTARVDFTRSLLGQGAVESADGNSFVIVRGESAIVYNRDQGTEAASAVFYADSLLRGERTLSQIPEAVRERVGQLRDDDEFRTATLDESGAPRAEPDSRMQLARGLAVTEAAPAIENVQQRVDRLVTEASAHVGAGRHDAARAVEAEYTALRRAATREAEGEAIPLVTRRVAPEAPSAAFEPRRFRETMRAEETQILADVERLGGTPDDIRHVAEGRRRTADDWQERAEQAMDNARRMEIEGSSEEIVNDAFAVAGRYERIAREYRESASRLDAEAAGREAPPAAAIVEERAPEQVVSEEAVTRARGGVIPPPPAREERVAVGAEEARTPPARPAARRPTEEGATRPGPRREVAPEGAAEGRRGTTEAVPEISPLLARQATERQSAQTEARRVRTVDEARAERSPEQVAQQELDLIDRIAAERGMDPAILREAYGQGGPEGRLAVLDALGIESPSWRTAQAEVDASEPLIRQLEEQIARLPQNTVEQLRARIVELEAEIQALPEGSERQRTFLNDQLNEVRGEISLRERHMRLVEARDQFRRGVQEFFEVVTRGDLQERIRGTRGFEGATITGVSHFGGLRGTYRVEMSNGRSVFVKVEDLAPARFGSDIARGEGMITSDTHSGYSYDTGLRVDGEPVMREFGLIEDIHDLAQGPRVTVEFEGTRIPATRGSRVEGVRLPDGQVEGVTVLGVAMLRDEVLQNPEPTNPAVRAFYRLAATQEGRQRIFQAWLAYHEMSRRALLIDRFTRNTAVVLVQRDSGEIVVTFQPIDTDGISSRIGGEPGRADFTRFDNDFAQGTAGFIRELGYGTAAALSILAPDGQQLYLGDRLGTRTLYGDMFSERALRGAALPPDPPEMRDAVRGVVQDYNGRPHGLGFDVASHGFRLGEGTFEHGGRVRIAERADGRVTMHADETLQLMDTAAGQQDGFIQRQRDAVAGHLAIPAVPEARGPPPLPRLGEGRPEAQPQGEATRPEGAVAPERPRRGGRAEEQPEALAPTARPEVQPPPVTAPGRRAVPGRPGLGGRVEEGQLPPTRPGRSVEEAPTPIVEREVPQEARPTPVTRPQPVEEATASMEAQFDRALSGRSVSLTEDGRREEAVVYGGGRAREGRPAVPERRYTHEQYEQVRRVAIDAERVLSGQLNVDDVPAERRPAVQRLLANEGFVSETRRIIAAGADQSIDRFVQLGIALEQVPIIHPAAEEVQPVPLTGERGAIPREAEAERRAAQEVIDASLQWRRMLEQGRSIDDIEIDMANQGVGEVLRNTILQMLQHDAGHPMVERLAAEYASGQAARQRTEAVETARGRAQEQAVGQIFHDVAEGRPNPTFDRLVEIIATRPDAEATDIRGRLLRAHQEGGMEGLRQELGRLHFPVERAITVLTLDRQVSSLITAGEPPAVIRDMAAARGMTVEAFRQTLADAYQRDGVYAVFDAILGYPPGLSDTQRAEIASQRRVFVNERPEFVEMLIVGNIEGNIRSLSGFGGVSIAGVEHLSGNAGAYRVRLSDGRSIFVKSESLEPSAFGARLLGAQGLVDISGGLHTVTYDTGVADAAGRPVTRTYGLSEDVHDFVGRTVPMRLPDGTSGEYRVRSVAMMGNEVMNPETMERILADPSDPRHEAVRLFVELASTPEGRAQIFQAWSAYHEMARRGMVIDRFSRNTALFVVDTPEGPRITFQPIDTDFVAGRIAPGEGGQPDYRGFYFDFARASANFTIELHRLLERRGIVIDRTALASEFIREHTGSTISSPPEITSQVVSGHDGRLFGLTERRRRAGSVNEHDGGRRRVVQDEQGGVVMHADEIQPLADHLSTQGSRREALQEMLNYFRREFGVAETEVPGMYPPPPPLVAVAGPEAAVAPVAPPPQAEAPLFRRGVPEGATVLTRRDRSPTAVLGEGVNIPREGRLDSAGQEYRFNGGVVIDGVTYARFTAGRGDAEQHILVRQAPAEMTTEQRVDYYSRGLQAAFTAPAEAVPVAGPPPPVVAVPAYRRWRAGEGTEIAGRARSPDALLGTGIRPPDVRVVHEGSEWRFNGGVEIDGQTYVRFSSGRGDAEQHIIVRQAPESMPVSDRPAYYREQVQAAITAPAEAHAPPPAEVPQAVRPQAEVPPAEEAAPVPLVRPAEVLVSTMLHQDTIEQQNFERLLEGSIPRSAALEAALPQGAQDSPVRRIAGVLEYLAHQVDEGRMSEADMQQRYPQYSEAVSQIRAARAREEGAGVVETVTQAQAIYERRGGQRGQHAREAVMRMTEHGVGAVQAREIVEGILTRSGELGPEALNMLTRLLDRRVPLEQATQAVEGAFGVARRYTEMLEGRAQPEDEVDRIFVQAIEGHSRARPGVSRELVVFEEISGIITDAARTRMRSTVEGEGPMQRPGEYADAAIYDIAAERARQNGRAEPSSEDFIYGAAALRPLGTQGRELVGMLSSDGMPLADARRVAEEIVSGSGEYGPGALSMINRFLRGRVPLAEARSAVDAYVAMARRFAQDELFVETVSRRVQNTGESRDLAALAIAANMAGEAERIGGEIANGQMVYSETREGARLTMGDRIIHNTAVDEAQRLGRSPAPEDFHRASIRTQSDLVVYEIALARARQSGRSEPNSDDLAIAVLSSISFRNGMAPEFMQGIERIRAQAPPERVPELVLQYTRTAAAIADRMSSSVMMDPAHAGMARNVFLLAADLHTRGIQDPVSILTNPDRTGLLDVFPVTDVGSLTTLADLSLSITHLLENIPSEHVQPTLRMLFEDASRLLPAAARGAPDPREDYVRAIVGNVDQQGAYMSGALQWTPELQAQVTQLSGARAGRRMPLLALAMAREEPSLLHLNNKDINQALGNHGNFRALVQLLQNLRMSRDIADGIAPETWVQGNRTVTQADMASAEGYLRVVRDMLDYLGPTVPSRTEAIASARRSLFDRETQRVRHINDLWALYTSTRITADALGETTRALRAEEGHLSSEQFRTAIGQFYTRFARDMGVPEAWARDHIEIFIDLVRYRLGLQRLRQLRHALHRIDFAGSPEAFEQAIPVFDAAVRAYAEGRFEQFRYEESGFHRELADTYTRSIDIEGRPVQQGEAIFRTWTTEAGYEIASSDGTVLGAARETGGFEEGFYGGRVRGSGSCQDPNNLHQTAAGLIGTLESPWTRSFVVDFPDSAGPGDSAYRRRLVLVHGDDGRPVLLVMPPYRSPSFQQDSAAAAGFDAAVMRTIRARYEPLGVEVRDISGPVMVQDYGINTGYRTFASGRSPFFYMDSNLHTFIGQREGRNGLHTRRSGESVPFPRGWSSTHQR